jgi:hypothetical protein
MAETMREMGLLVTLFAPLDFLFSDRSISANVVVAITVAGALMMVGGILDEGRE